MANYINEMSHSKCLTIHIIQSICFIGQLTINNNVPTLINSSMNDVNSPNPNNHVLNPNISIVEEFYK
jgi:hypothetical protein